MYPPSIITWILVIFGFVTCLPLFIAQLVMLFKPKSQKASDILIGKGEDWRDTTHYRSALGMAWADWLFFAPLLVAGSVGVLSGHIWGYVLWAAAGTISLYINIVLWFMEKAYVYPSQGPLVYFTYYWGFFIYWGAAALIYSIVRLTGLTL